MADKHKCKGSHLIQARDWIDGQLGRGSFDVLMERNGATNRGTLLPGIWYDIDPLLRTLTGLSSELGRTVEDIAAEISALNAQRDLTTIYRVFLRIAAPVRVLGFAPQMWRNYVSFGEAQVVKNEPGHFIGQGTGIPTQLLEWACGTWSGFVPQAILVAGGKNVRGGVLQRGPDATRAEMWRLSFEVRYTP